MDTVATIIRASKRSIGAFEVGRLLPSLARRSVGPFIFFDRMGPTQLAPGHGMDVRPHPHIGLATVTYLFEGEVVHRDSLGTHQTIVPGDINWMTAGRGIVHSERTSAALRQTGSRLDGLQLWVALPIEQEETGPAFHHYPASSLPSVDLNGVQLRVLAGDAYGARSPVQTHSPLFYVDALLPAGATLPGVSGVEERAAYVIQGNVTCGTQRVEQGNMAVFAPGAEVLVTAEEAARVILLGGAPLDGERHLWWNFVSSSKERLEQAKQDWRDSRFPTVPGDETEFVPLPE